MILPAPQTALVARPTQEGRTSEFYIPKYEQMTNQIRRRIEGLPNGARLPSVRALMKRYGVSMQTVGVALKQLKAERLLTAKRGSGLYVSQERPKPFIVLHRSQFSSRLTDAIEASVLRYIGEAGWHCLVSRYDDMQLTEKDIFAAPRASAHIIKAELVNPAYPRFLQICQQNVPVVAVNRNPGDLAMDYVASDGREIFQLLIQHLELLGHRSFGFLVNEPHVFEIEQRIKLLDEVLASRGFAPAHIIDCETKFGEDGSHQAYAALRRYLQKHRRRSPFTALICASSVVGLAVLRAFYDSGVRVPEDCSVAAFGAEPGDANAFCIPGLTEVDVSFEQWGQGIVNVLQRRFKGDIAPPIEIKIPSRLIVRESTGPVPAKAEGVSAWGRNRSLARRGRGRIVPLRDDSSRTLLKKMEGRK